MDPRLPGRGKEVKRIGISGLGLAIEREHRRISLFILLNFFFCYQYDVGSGLDGGTLHRSQSLKHIRRAIWDTYAPDNESISDDSSKPDEVRVLMLEKNTSSWQHSNYITNWQEMVSAVQSLPNVVVTSYSPQYQTFKTQVQ